MIEKVLKDVDQLSKTCLSTPWVETEPLLRNKMAEWHKTLIQLTERMPVQENSASEMDSNLLILQSGITELHEAMQTKNPVRLSNALSELWYPALKNIEQQLSE